MPTTRLGSYADKRKVVTKIVQINYFMLDLADKKYLLFKKVVI